MFTMAKFTLKYSFYNSYNTLSKIVLNAKALALVHFKEIRFIIVL